MSFNSQVYRNAVALNNIGVDLVQRRCFEEALLTMMDATAAMKEALKVYNCEQAVCPTNLRQVQSMVDRANKQRSRAVPMEKRDMHRTLNCADSYNAVQDQPSHQTLFPIRIDDISPDIRSPCAFQDPDIDSAIVLFNFGVANLYAAHFAPLHKREEYQSQASFLFELSESILERRGRDAEDELSLRQLTCVHLAVLSGLLQTVGDSMETQKGIVRKISQLHGTIKHLDEHLAYINAHSAAAA